jgi:very-short-patch-repair endonuclease
MEELHRAEGLVRVEVWAYDPSPELRKNMTPMEKKLWMGLFKDFPLRVARQKVIDNYIVDFYCAKLALVVEVDGNVLGVIDNGERKHIKRRTESSI